MSAATDANRGHWSTSTPSVLKATRVADAIHRVHDDVSAVAGPARFRIVGCIDDQALGEAPSVSGYHLGNGTGRHGEDCDVCSFQGVRHGYDVGLLRLRVGGGGGGDGVGVAMAPEDHHVPGPGEGCAESRSDLSRPDHRYSKAWPLVAGVIVDGSGPGERVGFLAIAEEVAWPPFGQVRGGRPATTTGATIHRARPRRGHRRRRRPDASLCRR